MQETLQIERLYREVRDEVREMAQNMLERCTLRITELQAAAEEWDRLQDLRNERRDSFPGVLAGPALTLSFLRVTGPVTIMAALLWTVRSAIVGAVLIGLYMLWVHRQT